MTNSQREISVVKVPAQGQIRKEVMGEDVAELNFVYGKKIDFQIGDYTYIFGNKYQLNQKPSVHKIAKSTYEYNLVMEGIKYDLAKVQYHFPDVQNSLNIPEWTLNANAERFIDLIVENANRVQSGWKKGIVEETEVKNINFSSNNLLQALSMLADEFGLEYWIDDDKTIHFAKHTVDRKRTFKYGLNKGLKSFKRENLNDSNIVTKLFAYGSSKNLPSGYLGKRLSLDEPLQKNTKRFGVIEHTEIFEDIFPHRTGTVTAVTSSPFEFIDSGIDFNLKQTDSKGNSKYLIPGVSAKVTFNSGQLAGYTFEIAEAGFDFAQKKVKIIKNKEEQNIDAPSELLRPAVGDMYVITDIIMPESYISKAKENLKEAAQKYLDENSVPQSQYLLESDPIYFNREMISLHLGEQIRIIDEDLHVDEKIRVVSIRQDLQNRHRVEFRVAKTISQNEIVRNYIQAERQRVIQTTIRNFNEKMTRLNWLFSQELLQGIFDSEGYFDASKIRPLSIETKMLSVGSRLQQFGLPGVILSLSDLNTFNNTEGHLVHLTIDENKSKTWNIVSKKIAGFGDEFYYIYAKCSRSSSAGEIILSRTPIKVLDFPDWYYFEVGFLSSVVDGIRRIKTTYGFSTINGGEITTGRIASADGQNWIDILGDSIDINAKVRFSNDSPAYKQVQTYVDEKLAAITSGETGITDAIIDGIVTKAEAKAIITYLEQIKTDKAQIEARLSEFIQHVNDDAKRDELTAVKNVLMASFNDLYTTIEKAILDEAVSDTEKQSIAQKFEAYRNAVITAMELMESINSVSLKNALENAESAKIAAEKAEKLTSFLDTTIDGNVIGTGVLQVGEKNKANAGISGLNDSNVGAENYKDSVRFWAGSDFAGRRTAPFRVMSDGSLYSVKGMIGGLRIEKNALTSKSDVYDNNYTELNDDGSIVLRKTQSADNLSIGSLLVNDEKDTSTKIIHQHTKDEENTALYLYARNMRYPERAVALHVNGGKIKVGDKYGYTGDVIIGNAERGKGFKLFANVLEINNGIITGFSKKQIN